MMMEIYHNNVNIIMVSMKYYSPIFIFISIQKICVLINVKIGVKKMSQPNKNCKNCDKPFYSCTSCVEKGLFHWKSICCCEICFQEYIKKVEEGRNKNER